MRLSVIIAVYNEAATARTLLANVLKQPLPRLEKEIVIVESKLHGRFARTGCGIRRTNASNTGTAIRVILPAGTTRQGARDQSRLGARTGDIILIQDADLEYDVADYPELLQPIIAGRAATEIKY